MHIKSSHIYFETFKTQRFTSTVSFTGLTWCCFSIQYFILSRDKQQLTVKRILPKPFVFDVTTTLVIFNKTWIASVHLTQYVKKTVIVDGQTSYQLEKKTQNVSEIIVYNLYQQNRVFVDVALKSSTAHYRLTTFGYFATFLSSKRYFNSHLVAQLFFGYCNFLGQKWSFM